MAQLVDIQRVEVGPQSLTATVRIADAGPLMTSEDLEGTTRVYNLMPHIIEHVCLGDAGETFRDVMGNTELAHLLEHVTVELLAESNVAGDIASGRTRAVGEDGRTFEIELACPDDVLVAGALSSACWILGWAYSGGGDPEPDVEATVQGLVGLVQSLPDPEGAAEQVPSGPRLVTDEEPAAAPASVPAASGPALALDAEAAPEPVAAAPEPVAEVPPKASPEGIQAALDMPEQDGELATTGRLDAVSPAADDDIPLPRLVR